MTKEQELKHLKQELSRVEVDYNIAKKETDRIFQIKYDIQEQINKLNFELKNYITDLSPYNSKELLRIICLDSKGEEVYIPDDEFVSVEDGRLECSSYQNGLLWFDEEKQKYIHTYHFIDKETDIIGFRDIVAREKNVLFS